MSILLKTDRLILRDFKLNDLNAYFQITQCPKYQIYYSNKDCSYSKAQELVSLFVNSASVLPRRIFQCAVILKDTEKFIGSAGIRVESNSNASIGCGFDTDYQKFGYAIEAMEKLIGFGFEQLDLKSIYAKTISQNEPAVRLCEKLGMVVNCNKTIKKTIKNKEWDEFTLELHKKNI